VGGIINFMERGIDDETRRIIEEQGVLYRGVKRGAFDYRRATSEVYWGHYSRIDHQPKEFEHVTSTNIEPGYAYAYASSEKDIDFTIKSFGFTDCMPVLLVIDAIPYMNRIRLGLEFFSPRHFFSEIEVIGGIDFGHIRVVKDLDEIAKLTKIPRKNLEFVRKQ